MTKTASMLRKAALTVLAGAAMTALVAGTALAQAWPTRQITMVVPFPAGGTPGDLAALVKSELAKWGPIIKENNISFE